MKTGKLLLLLTKVVHVSKTEKSNENRSFTCKTGQSQTVEVTLSCYFTGFQAEKPPHSHSLPLCARGNESVIKAFV